MYVMDKDLVTLESQASDALLVLLNLDALVTATQNTLQGTTVRNRLFIRSLLAIGGDVEDTCKVLMAQLHQIVTLRRDSALGKQSSLSPGHVMWLLHAPFLGESCIYPQSLLFNVTDQRHADQQKTL